MNLTGKTALVTGSTSGIGLGIALKLAEAGADLILNGFGDASTALAEVGRHGHKVGHHGADVSDPAQIAELFAHAERDFGGIDILVNNAGIIRRADAVDFTESDWDAVMDVNLKAVFFTCQAFGRAALDAGRGGKIVNIASLLSFQGGIRVPSYTAAKHGVAGITKLLANEWAARGINVNAIAPGYIETNNTEALRADPERNAAILARIPAGRWGRAEDIGQAAVFLASPAAGYVHGAVLNVDGGWLAR